MSNGTFFFIVYAKLKLLLHIKRMHSLEERENNRVFLRSNKYTIKTRLENKKKRKKIATTNSDENPII